MEFSEARKVKRSSLLKGYEGRMDITGSAYCNMGNRTVHFKIKDGGDGLQSAWLAWTCVSRFGAVGCWFVCRSYADYRCFSLPFYSIFTSFYLAPSIFFLGFLLCSMRHQVVSATMRRRAALSSATASLRAPELGPGLQTSTKRFIVWTGCCRVSLQRMGVKCYAIIFIEWVVQELLFSAKIQRKDSIEPGRCCLQGPTPK